VSKINTKDIADKIRAKGLESSTRHIEDTIFEMILQSIDIEGLTEQVLEHLQELEHPEPRNKAEYDERIGADKDE